MALCLQLLPQLGKVLDDPVVDHHDLLVAVRMGMRVDHRGTPMRGPPGVADSETALGHLFGQAVDQGVDLGGALDDRGLPLSLVEDGDPGGVVAAVLEPLQALHDDGCGRPLAQVADDPAHACGLLYSQPGRAQTSEPVCKFSLNGDGGQKVTARHLATPPERPR